MLAAKVPTNALADMLRGNQAALRGDYAEANQIYTQLPQDEMIGLIRPLLLAWTIFGQGDAQKALAELEALHFQRRQHAQPDLRAECWRLDRRCRA